jgi:hypothetical protein
MMTGAAWLGSGAAALLTADAPPPSRTSSPSASTFVERCSMPSVTNENVVLPAMSNDGRS